GGVEDGHQHRLGLAGAGCEVAQSQPGMSDPWQVGRERQLRPDPDPPVTGHGSDFVDFLAAVAFAAFLAGALATVFFAAVFLAVVFFAAFLAVDFLAVDFLAVFFTALLRGAGPLARLSASNSMARSRLSSSTESSRRSVALVSPSVTYGPNRPSLTTIGRCEFGSSPS